jgi:hypothetical protein
VDALVPRPRSSFNNSQAGNGLDSGFMGQSGGSLTDPQPKFPQSRWNAPIMVIGAPSRPRRCNVFDSLSSGAAQRRIFGTRGRSKGTGGMVAGCKTTSRLPLQQARTSSSYFWDMTLALLLRKTGLRLFNPCGVVISTGMHSPFLPLHA